MRFHTSGVSVVFEATRDRVVKVFPAMANLAEKFDQAKVETPVELYGVRPTHLMHEPSRVSTGHHRLPWNCLSKPLRTICLSIHGFIRIEFRGKRVTFLNSLDKESAVV